MKAQRVFIFGVILPTLAGCGGADVIVLPADTPAASESAPPPVPSDTTALRGPNLLGSGH